MNEKKIAFYAEKLLRLIDKGIITENQILDTALKQKVKDEKAKKVK